MMNLSLEAATQKTLKTKTNMIIGRRRRYLSRNPTPLINLRDSRRGSMKN